MGIMSWLPCLLLLLVVLLHGVFSACIAHAAMDEELADDGLATFFTDFRETECFGSDHSLFPKGPRITALHHRFFSKSMCGRCLRVNCIHGHCNNHHNNDDDDDDDDAVMNNNKIRSSDDDDGSGAGVIVMVADRCDGNCQGDLDLSLSAFSRIADPQQGIIHVHYAWADCP